jgi:hypothetical protein
VKERKRGRNGGRKNKVRQDEHRRYKWDRRTQTKERKRKEM